MVHISYSLFHEFAMTEQNKKKSILPIIFPTICGVFFLLDMIGYDRQVIYGYAWWISIVYFIIDFIVEIMNRSFEYIVHHTVCLTLLLLRLVWSGGLEHYATFMHLGLTTELSNVFMHMRFILEKDSKAAYYNNLTFVFVWFGTRIFYALPYAIWYISYEKHDGGHPLVLGAALYSLSALHVYWGYLILQKVYREVTKSNKAV